MFEIAFRDVFHKGGSIHIYSDNWLVFPQTSATARGSDRVIVSDVGGRTLTGIEGPYFYCQFMNVDGVPYD